MPSRIETLLEPLLATARSGKLSPFRSPIATEWGPTPRRSRLPEEKDAVEAVVTARVSRPASAAATVSRPRLRCP